MRSAYLLSLPSFALSSFSLHLLFHPRLLPLFSFSSLFLCLFMSVFLRLAALSSCWLSSASRLPSSRLPTAARRLPRRLPTSSLLEERGNMCCITYTDEHTHTYIQDT